MQNLRITPSKVILLSTTVNEEVSGIAARFCTSGDDIQTLLKTDTEKASAILRRVMNQGHRSVAEHVNFTFAIEGISRVTSHQLVRHRIASYSQKSQRYVILVGDYEIVVPPSIIDNVAALNLYLDLAQKAQETYHNLEALGIPAEDARYALLEGTETKIMVTMNARELLHFFGERLCSCAQWEIRGVAKKMVTLARDKAPVLFEKVGPKCVQLRYCPESWKRWCGVRPHETQVFREEECTY